MTLNANARQSPGPAIRHQTPLKVPGGWSDMPPPPRLQGFDTLSQAHEADFGTRPEGGVEEHAGSQAGPGGSGWFKWITDAGGNTMSRGA
ncbi:hypothetical protein BD324DRAFT_628987 [Kockovaella imperatae]|uniref:Uncharacterized protein n=1 Tax=Kockovaella imperatae TaxID=4999 RepID=A0A1Y1UEK0_9TREE|nr:hypothetical protein BD324DRAFT_628987 [Kockovaella imperatae]ORX36473.1 hypothetical protein BD324DRAFT_628987 [Kockovaella imperatae]